MNKKTYRLPIWCWPEGERPRERLLHLGPSEVTDAELLAILLRGGPRGQSAVELGRTLLAHTKTLRGLDQASPQALAEVRGIGLAKAAQLKAALELGKRVVAEPRAPRPRISSSKEVFELVRPRLGTLQKEVCQVLLLNSNNEVLAVETLSEGSVTESAIYPREAVALANRHNAAALVLVHNHPSGNPQPSPGDRQITEELVFAGRIMRIALLDHVIVGDADYYSFADHGLIDRYQRAFDARHRRA